MGLDWEWEGKDTCYGWGLGGVWEFWSCFYDTRLERVAQGQVSFVVLPKTYLIYGGYLEIKTEMMNSWVENDEF